MKIERIFENISSNELGVAAGDPQTIRINIESRSQSGELRYQKNLSDSQQGFLAL